MELDNYWLDFFYYYIAPTERRKPHRGLIVVAAMKSGVNETTHTTRLFARRIEAEILFASKRLQQIA
jgi:hypothetical protein